MAIARHPRSAAAPRSHNVANGLASGQVWQELRKATFAVIGYVTPRGESRSSGVVFKTVGKRLYFVVAPDSWKARHIASSHEVSVTVPVRRGGALTLLWPIPPATISFHATSIVHPAGHLAKLPKELEALLPGERRNQGVLIEIIPYGAFLTYGIGVPLQLMRNPELARASVPIHEPPAESHDRPAIPFAAVYGLMALALAGAIAGIWIPVASIVALIGVVGVLLVARRAVIPDKPTRLALFGTEAFVAVTAIQGGAGLLRTSFGLPLDWLERSPFTDYVIPGLALLLLVGATNAVAAATAFVRRGWALVLAALAGTLMAGYEVVEILSVDGNVGSDLPIVLPAQLLWFAAGVAVVALSGRLWTKQRARENREAQTDVVHPTIVS